MIVGGRIRSFSTLVLSSWMFLSRLGPCSFFGSCQKVLLPLVGKLGSLGGSQGECLPFLHPCAILFSSADTPFASMLFVVFLPPADILADSMSRFIPSTFLFPSVVLPQAGRHGRLPAASRPAALRSCRCRSGRRRGGLPCLGAEPRAQRPGVKEVDWCPKNAKGSNAISIGRMQALRFGNVDFGLPETKLARAITFHPLLKMQ